MTMTDDDGCGLRGNPGPTCQGMMVPGFDRCLGHLDVAERQGFLDGLAIDNAPLIRSGLLRGIEIDGQLLKGIIPHLAILGADFNGSRFVDSANFENCCFPGASRFEQVTFHRLANFQGCQQRSKIDPFTPVEF
jgi:hypothetical protein